MLNTTRKLAASFTAAALVAATIAPAAGAASHHHKHGRLTSSAAAKLAQKTGNYLKIYPGDKVSVTGCSTQPGGYNCGVQLLPVASNTVCHMNVIVGLVHALPQVTNVLNVACTG